jgi:hypothetical protein
MAEARCRRWLLRQKYRLDGRWSPYWHVRERGYKVSCVARRSKLAGMSSKKAFRMLLALGSVIASMT